ncbi:hypothetical protein ACFY0Z_30090 [Streptomyces kronopolitis]|uniref:hypothetical protein n=1 Tax=Streptomyces kronopolitis TaxID=1612435 RepID=UPI003683F1F4
MDTYPLPDLVTIAPAVARHLGAGWSAQPHQDSDWSKTAFLVHRDGRRVRVSVDPYASGPIRQQLTVRGSEPEPAPEGATRELDGISFGLIRCAGTKSPERVAKEIARRLLPKMAAAYETWHAKVEQLREQETLRWTVAERLAAVPGMSQPARPTHRVSALTPWSLHWRGPDRGGYSTTPRASVSVDAGRHGEHVELTLSGLNAEEAQRVLCSLVAPGGRPALAPGR